MRIDIGRLRMGLGQWVLASGPRVEAVMRSGVFADQWLDGRMSGAWDGIST